jgi:hypothetical protein
MSSHDSEKDPLDILYSELALEETVSTAVWTYLENNLLSSILDPIYAHKENLILARLDTLGHRMISSYMELVCEECGVLWPCAIVQSIAEPN